MTYTFYKYQGTGNDFILIDNRQYVIDKNNTNLIKSLCDRRFGIGADGLILLEDHDTLDYKMVYFNSDGRESSMCGNGGRCLAAFAKQLKVIDDQGTFEAIDGVHKVIIEGELIKLQMKDVDNVEKYESHIFLNTGSPHHVQFESDLETLNIKEEGAKIRYGKPYKEVGTNVNFVHKIKDDVFAIRTYERGVEDETLSCGTGVTAAALAMNYNGDTEKDLITLKTKGGELQVSFDRKNGSYKNIWLIGPAKLVFKGTIEW